MLAIISPAKTLDFESAVRNLPVSQPHLTDYSEQLIEICRQLSPQDLSSLMSISDKLAGLNAARFAEWTKSHNEKNSRAAIWAFKGDVYTGLDADVSIQNSSEVDEKIKEALDHNGPVIVNVRVDKQELAMPPKIAYQQAKGFSKYLINAILDGRGTELKEMAKTNWMKYKSLY